MKSIFCIWCLLMMLKPLVITCVELLNRNPHNVSKNFALTSENGEIFESSLLSAPILVEMDNKAVLKSIEVLGDLLRKKVQMFHVEKDRKVDLVFLIDASHSVGAKNFNSEIKFVKKLLADFTISVNETRVAIITFSDKIVRHVDHISIPYEEYHKCNMLHYDFSNIHFIGGNTDILGAFVEAQSVLEWSRVDAMKAVFLITDGFSNGGNPEPVVKVLKESGIHIFTFGIKSGNTQELQNISSSPSEEFSYLLQSFDQFEALARRALHHDLPAGPFQILENTSSCDLLCSIKERGENGCCDQKALCSCGTASGHYTCLCPASYYGVGVKGYCFPCPSGTYHDGNSSGDESICAPCPDPNHITILGNATSRDSCLCKTGFVAKGDACKVITCPHLSPPEHGYFVKGQGLCPNVFNAACGMRCKVGYTLYGSSIRLCQENGTWSGSPPKCIVKMCPDLDTPENGHIECSHEWTEHHDVLNVSEPRRVPTNLFAVDTACEFSCQEGNVLIGSKRRVCLPLARWDGRKTVCKSVMCSALTKLAHGTFTPAKCVEAAKLPVGQVCNITCEKGYQLMGPLSRRCEGKGGHWSVKSNSSHCIDVEPPVITCPNSIKVTTEPGKPFAIVAWSNPEVSDNSGKTPLVWTQPTTMNPMNVSIGSTLITYIALDPSLNQATCSFNITVLDTEAPVILSCNSPSPIHLTGQNKSGYASWTSPEFLDNSGRGISVHSSHQYGEFPAGETQVIITGSDWAGNNSTCMLDIVLKVHPCTLSILDVNHGSATCKPVEDMLHCLYSCLEGYSFHSSHVDVTFFNNTGNGSLFYSCPSVLTQSNMLMVPAIDDFPLCSETIAADAVSQEGFVSAIGEAGICEDSKLIENVKMVIEASLSNQTHEFCKNQDLVSCSLLSTGVLCEEVKLTAGNGSGNIRNLKRSADLLSRQSGTEQHAAVIQVNFNVVSKLQNRFKNTSNSEGKLFSNIGFNELKSSVHDTDIVLPQGIRFRSLNWRGGSSSINCKEGSVPLPSENCLKCSSGSFFSHETQTCYPCPVGKYQEKEGQLHCKSCPRGMTTKREGSHSHIACRYLCPPGSFSIVQSSHVMARASTMSPCTLCSPGSYQPDFGASSCLSCPNEKSVNSFSGAKSERECVKFETFNMSLPLHCHSEFCHNGGSCIQTAEGYLMCLCQKGYYGSICELAVNSCDSSPCLHNALCVLEDSITYSCSCPPGFHGDNCEIEVNECHSNPCLNNGTCEDLMDGFYCDCPEGFQGLICEEIINHCEGDPCGTYGDCRNHSSGYSCSCFSGFSGMHCEMPPLNACISGLCLNGAACSSINHTAYECICLPQWHGKHCELQRNGCLSSPCSNNSTCVNNGDAFTCHCSSSFYGKYCETRVSSQFVLHFPVSSVTNYAVVNLPATNLSEVSICLWLQSTDDINYGTVFSYAVGSQYNALTLTDYNGFVLYVNGEWIISDISINDGVWHHVCVLWQADEGKWAIYVDGALKSNGSQLSPNKAIAGSGIFVLAQEQDSLGGGFSESESFVGRIYGLNVWNNLLHSTTVSKHVKECHQSIEGSVVRWVEFSSGIRGRTEVENSSFCSDCPSPVPVWRGTVSIVKTESGLVASYVCGEGFVFQQNKKRELLQRCMKHGSWEGPTPICVRRNCGFPGYLRGGTFIGRSFLYTDTIFYKCLPGYQISGNTSRTCKADGQWSGSQPVCKGRACPVLTPPENCEVIYSELGGIQVALFLCNLGFQLDGAEKLLCMLDGSWDESPPKCLKKKCSPPPHIENAVLLQPSNNTFLFGDTVQYSCKEHYVMTPGNVTLECNVDGSWTFKHSMQSPECKPVLCLKPDHLKHGKWVVKSRPKTLISTTTVQHFPINSVIEAKCDEDFRTDGPSLKRCDRNGHWIPLDVTQCAKITCDTESLPHGIPNSQLNYTGEEVGDVVTLACRHGFQMVTSNVSHISEVPHPQSEYQKTDSLFSWKCHSDGSWNMIGEVSTHDIWILCLNSTRGTSNAPANCSAPQAPAFGYILSNSNFTEKSLENSIVNIRCRSGYILEGPSSSICHSNGTWIGLATSQCKPVQCRIQPHFPNMVVKHSTAVGPRVEFGNLMTFKCLSGFKAHGDLSIRCQTNGQWSSMRGICLN